MFDLGTELLGYETELTAAVRRFARENARRRSPGWRRRMQRCGVTLAMRAGAR